MFQGPAGFRYKLSDLFFKMKNVQDFAQQVGYFTCSDVE